MWLLVVAAGSGYLAKCLQNASSTKKLRLSDLVQNDQGDSSRSPPQGLVDNYPLSEEAVQVKDRFERLEEEENLIQNAPPLFQEKASKKRSSCCGKNSDVLEGSLVSMTSFQRGIHHVQSSEKCKRKAKGWSEWPKQPKSSQADKEKVCHEKLADKSQNDDQLKASVNSEGLRVDFQKDILEVSDVESEHAISASQEKHEMLKKEDTGRQVYIDVKHPSVSNGEASITMKTPLGDVSWRTSKQDAEKISMENLEKGSAASGDQFGDLPSIFDWTSMAASQKHLMFGVDVLAKQAEGKLKRTSTNRRHGECKLSRGKSKCISPEQSSSCVPNSLSLESSVRKRKAADCVLSTFERVNRDSGYRISAKEMLLFAMGVHIGVSCMLFYHKSQMEKLVKQPDDTDKAFHSIYAEGGKVAPGGDGALNFEADEGNDDNESVTSVVTVEHTETDQMAVLEAELEAELEIMQLNLKEDELPHRQNKDLHSHGSSDNTRARADPSDKLGDDLSHADVNDWAISPRELDRRLHIVLEERQEKRIRELEAELKEAERKLHIKEDELLSWKDRVYRLTEMASTSGEVVERPVSRRKWFSEDMESSGLETGRPRWIKQNTTVHASLALAAAGSSYITERDEENCARRCAVSREGVNGEVSKAFTFGPKKNEAQQMQMLPGGKGGPIGPISAYSKSSVRLSNVRKLVHSGFTREVGKDNQRIRTLKEYDEDSVGPRHGQMQSCWRDAASSQAGGQVLQNTSQGSLSVERSHFLATTTIGSSVVRQSTSNGSSCFVPVNGTVSSSIGSNMNIFGEAKRNGFGQDGFDANGEVLAAAEVRESEARVEEEHLVYVNTNPLWNFSSHEENGCQESQVIRSMETTCRIEERRFNNSQQQQRTIHQGEDRALTRLTERRHSTGNALHGTQRRSQRQRRRWFS